VELDFPNLRDAGINLPTYLIAAKMTTLTLQSKQKVSCGNCIYSSNAQSIFPISCEMETKSLSLALVQKALIN
jgi:hypothetical protein